MIKRIVILLGFLVAGAAGGAAYAQDIDYRQRQADLKNLSRVFGELHHIRRMCDSRNEADVWRERMKKLVELESPQAQLHKDMVDAFNSGYTTAQNRYDRCDRRARDYAAGRASEGDRMVTSLLTPLYESVSGSGDLPTVWRGNLKALRDRSD